MISCAHQQHVIICRTGFECLSSFIPNHHCFLNHRITSVLRVHSDANPSIMDFGDDQEPAIEAIDSMTANELKVMKDMGLPTKFSGHQIRPSKIPGRNKGGMASNTSLSKYYGQRYRLFEKFDDGIRLDDESWYSVTPEAIAKHIAQRCAVLRPAIVVDACCGAGGNAIQFALECPDAQVIAVDICPEKISLARNNAEVYKVDHKIEFIVADFMQVAAHCRIPADIVFLSPQWGGPGYLTKASYSIEWMIPNGREMINVIRKNMTENIAFLLPRNADLSELQSVAGEENFVEVEKNSIANKTKTQTAYFGSLIQYN